MGEGQVDRLERLLPYQLVLYQVPLHPRFVWLPKEKVNHYTEHVCLPACLPLLLSLTDCLLLLFELPLPFAQSPQLSDVLHCQLNEHIQPYKSN
jgi:hypothetical protein